MSRRYLAEAPPGPRTDNLAGACVIQLAKTSLAGADRYGELVSSAALEPAVAHVREVMRQDRDLSAWIARKTFFFLPKMLELGVVSDTYSWPEPAFGAMGLESAGPAQVRLLPGSEEELDVDGRASAVELGSMARWVLSAASSPPSSWPDEVRAPYVDLYTGESGEDVEEKAYVITAWGSIAIGRLLTSGRLTAPFQVWAEVPEMSIEGWYPNPPKNGDVSSGDAQFQRYWDGAWTDRIRVRQSGGWTTGSLSLHDTPTD